MKISNAVRAKSKRARSFLNQALIITLLPVLSQMPTAALAEDTGFNSPAISYPSDGTAFADPNNAFSDNSSYAFEDTDGIVQQYGNFSLPTIPTGAGINGIVVEINAKSDGTSQTRKFNATLSWDGGTTFTSGSGAISTVNFGTSDSTDTVGTITNNWGRTWIPGEFTNTNFRVRLESDLGNDRDIYLDHVQVKVDYTPAPSNLNASAVSGFEIDLSWDDNSNNETEFLLERSTAPDSGFVEIAQLNSDMESYKDEGLDCGATYYYRVRAHKAAGAFTAYADVANATTNACVGADETPPTIIITTPAENDVYILNQVVYADYYCEDNVAVASCVGDVADGAPIETDSVGPHTFTVEAEDTATPPNTASLTNHYTIAFGWCSGFFPPLGPGPSEYKAGSTIPVKFQLCDYFGNPVGTASGTAWINTATVASAAIRYDATAEQYIANLKTIKGTTPGSYTITVELNDGTSHTIGVILK